MQLVPLTELHKGCEAHPQQVTPQCCVQSKIVLRLCMLTVYPHTHNRIFGSGGGAERKHVAWCLCHPEGINLPESAPAALCLKLQILESCPCPLWLAPGRCARSKSHALATLGALAEHTLGECCGLRAIFHGVRLARPSKKLIPRASLGKASRLSADNSSRVRLHIRRRQLPLKPGMPMR